VFTLQTPPLYPLSSQRMGTLTEKRKLELNKIVEKQRSNSKEEMDYLLKRLEFWNLGDTILSDMRYSLQAKDIQIKALERDLKRNESHWDSGNVWMKRLFTLGLLAVAVVCLLKGTGFMAPPDKRV
jgi:hypothetical protein